MSVPSNNAMHQTRREGVPASRAIVEARLAGDCGCSTGIAARRFTANAKGHDDDQ